MLAVVALAVAVGLLPVAASDVEQPASIITIAEIPELSRGDNGPLVAQLQDSLADVGFRPGANDGSYGRGTYQAVMAFQKHHGLDRDGVFRPEYWPMLSISPEVRWRSDTDRVEIDLGKQVLYLVQDNEVVNVLPISSGNGKGFTNYAGNPTRAVTPEGRFAFYKQRNYYHQSYLGAMYKPYYFRGGYAIHGSPNVPGYPASHGCIRVTNSDMDYLRQYLEIGMPVYVYGKSTSNPESDKPYEPLEKPFAIR